MQPYKKQQKPKPAYQGNQQQCKNGFTCPYLERNCKNKHDKLDIERSQVYSRIKKINKTIVILDTLSSKPIPICLFSDILPINFIDKKNYEAVKAGIYYEAQFISITQANVVIFKITQERGNFGDLKKQIDIMKQFQKKWYQFQTIKNNDQKPQFGKIDISWNYQKILKGDGYKGRFNQVNKLQIYPLLSGSEIRYLKPASKYDLAKVISAKHQQRKLTGILQIDPAGLFYLQCRNMKIDDMSPNSIPDELIQEVPLLKEIMPYSMLKKYGISEKLQKDINAELRKLVVKGQFYAWPEQARYPLMTLYPQFGPLTFKTLRDAIVYELNAGDNKFTNKQIKEAMIISKKFKIQNHKNRKQQKMPVFAIDNKGTRCHDDAFSIIKIQENLKISIHIADVAELIHESDITDKQMQKRDQTIYIKNYYQPLLPREFIDILSLREGNKKLAYTLSFYMNKDSLIDFETVKFQKSIVSVQKNYSHNKNLCKDEQLSGFFDFGQRIKQLNLLQSGYFIGQETPSEENINKLVYLSSLIPSAMIRFNEKRASNCKILIDQYMVETIENIKKKIKQWEQSRKKIKEIQKKCSKIREQQLKVQSIIRRQLQKERKRITAQLKNQRKQKKQNKNKHKHEKGDLKGQRNTSSQSEQYSEDDQNIQNIQQISVVGPDDIQQQKLQKDKQDEIKQGERKQKMEKLLNKKIKKIEQSSGSEQFSDQGYSSLDQEEGEMAKLKKQAAQGGFRMISKLFSFYDISTEWNHKSDISKAFIKLRQKNKSQLFHKYIKRAEIMNSQHFKYWLKPQQKKYGPKKEGQKSGTTQQSQRNFRDKYQKKEQELQDQNQMKKQKKQMNQQPKKYRKDKNRNQYVNKYKVKDQQEQKLQKKDNKQKQQEEIILETPNKEKKVEQKKYQKYQKNTRQNKKDIQVIKNGEQNLKILERIAKNNAAIYFSQYYEGKRDLQFPNLQKASEEAILDSEQQIQMSKNMSPEIKTNYCKLKIKQIKNISMNYRLFTLNDQRQCQKQIGVKLIDQIKDKIANFKKSKEIELFRINYESVFNSLKQRCGLDEEIIHGKQNDKHIFNDEIIDSKLFVADEQLKQLSELNSKQKYYYGKYKIIEIRKKLFEKQKQRKLRLNKIKTAAIKAIMNNLQHYQNEINLEQQHKENKQKLGKQLEQMGKIQEIEQNDIEEYLNSKIQLIQQMKKKEQIGKQSEKFIKIDANQNASKFWKKFYREHKKELQQLFQAKQNPNKQEKNVELKQKQIQTQLYVPLEDTEYRIFRSIEECVIYSKYKKQFLKNMFDEQHKNYIQKTKREQKKISRNVQKKTRTSKIQKQQKIQNQQKKEQGKDESEQPIKQKIEFKAKLTQTGDDSLSKTVTEPQKDSSQVTTIIPIIPKQNSLEDNQNIKQLVVGEQSSQVIKPLNKISSKPPTKKKLKQLIDKMLQPHKKQLEQKHELNKIKQKVTEQTNQLKVEIKQKSEQIKTNISGVQRDYNLLDYTVSLYTKNSTKKKNTKKNKNSKKNKQQVNQTVQSINTILDILEDYSHIAGCKFKMLPDTQVEDYITEKIKPETLISQQNQKEDLVKLNKQFVTMFKNQDNLLKWNNPIRSYAALKTLRFIKKYSWMLNGRIKILDVLQHHKDLKNIKADIKQIEDFKNQKIELGQVKRNYQEANREIEKLQFYYTMKKNQHQVLTFLNVTSPNEREVKFVYHPTLGEVQVFNFPFKQKLYEQVKGKVKIISQFPIDLKIQLLE